MSKEACAEMLPWGLLETERAERERGGRDAVEQSFSMTRGRRNMTES